MSHTNFQYQAFPVKGHHDLCADEVRLDYTQLLFVVGIAVRLSGDEVDRLRNQARENVREMTPSSLSSAKNEAVWLREAATMYEAAISSYFTLLAMQERSQVVWRNRPEVAE